MTRSTRAKAGNRLLSQRTVPSPSVAACSRVSCSEPAVRRRSLIPATNQALLFTLMTRGGATKGISRLSTGGTWPRNVTVCRPGWTCSHSELSTRRTTRAPGVPSIAIASGRQPPVEPGSGIATFSSACTDRVIAMDCGLISTTAETISAHRGTQSGASSRRCSSSLSRSASGISALASGLPDDSPTSNAVMMMLPAWWRPSVSPVGRVHRRLKISAAIVPANNSSSVTAMTRIELTSQRGITTSSIV